MSIDPFKYRSYGVKRTIGEKIHQLQHMPDDVRYYPTGKMGKQELVLALTAQAILTSGMRS